MCCSRFERKSPTAHLLYTNEPAFPRTSNAASAPFFPPSLNPKPAALRERLILAWRSRFTAMEASTCAAAKTDGVRRARQVACAVRAERDDSCLSGEVIDVCTSSLSSGKLWTSVKSRTNTWMNKCGASGKMPRGGRIFGLVDDSIN